jgi:hypothetical protein
MRFRKTRALLTLVMLSVPLAISSAQTDSTIKSAGTAGVLSYLFPGAGSYYAGDNHHHALVHAAVGVSSAVAMLPAINEQCAPPKKCQTSTEVIALAGLVTYVVNSVWSIITAVHDANAHNALVLDLRAADSTAGKTIAAELKRSDFGIRGAHYALGLGSVPYLDRLTGTLSTELRTGFTLSAFPDWTVTYAHSVVHTAKSTDYFVRDCNSGRGCYPGVYVNADAFELQRRWRRDLSVHPVVAASGGSLRSRYAYFKGTGTAFEPGVWDSTQYRVFATVSAGAEVDIWRWIHGLAYAGYRQASGRTIPDGKSSNSGPILAGLIELGKF